MQPFTEVETDVLVVGSGSAGTMAAIRARLSGASVLMATKGPSPSGNSCKALSGYAAAFGHTDPRDNPDVHFGDVVRNGVGLCNQKLVRKWVGEICDLTLEMADWGLDLIRNEDGRFSQIPWEGHTYPRMVHHHRVTGKYLMKCLGAKSAALGVKVLAQTVIAGFFKHDGEISGAWAANYQTGALYLIRAKSVVICTGGVGALYPHGDNVGTVTGEGYAFAFEAGADLLGMEFGHFLATPVFPEKMQAHVSFMGFVNGMINESQGRLYNGVGERFMFRYYPESGERGLKAEKLVRCFAEEIVQGRAGLRGGVYFDATDVPAEFAERDRYRRFFELAERAGMNLRRDPLELVPYPHDLVGGIRIDEEARTSVPGLFAAGEAAGGAHGASRFGGSALSDCLVFGSASGRNAAARAAERSHHAPIEKAQREACEVKLSDWRKGAGARPQDVLKELGELAFNHLNMVRNEAGLRTVLGRVADVKGELANMSIGDDDGTPVRLRQAVEAEGQVRLCELMAHAALERKESRGGYFGGHYRTEYAEQDDENWRKNIILVNREGSIGVSHEDPVEIELQSDLVREILATEWAAPNDPSHFAVSE